MKRSSVLLAGLLLPSGVLPALACDPPETFTHTATGVEGSALVKAATDLPVYSLGQEVRFFLSVENQGAGTVQFTSGASPMQAFVVLPDSCPSLDHEDCAWHIVFLDPEIVYFNGDAVILAPGECRTWTSLWDGRVFNYDTMEFELPSPGRYHVFIGLFRYVGGLQPIDFIVPEDGVILDIVLGGVGGVGSHATSWGSIKRGS